MAIGITLIILAVLLIACITGADEIMSPLLLLVFMALLGPIFGGILYRLFA